MRQYPPAMAWFQGQRTLSITPLVCMELVAGAQNKTSQLQALQVLSQYDIVYLTQTDMAWAMQQLLAFRLSHGVDILDCLIASVSHCLQVPLYTQNLKHFMPLLGPLAQKPY